MKKITFLIAIFTAALTFISVSFPFSSKAQDARCSASALSGESDSQFLIDGQSCLNNLNQALTMSENATKPLESQVSSMQAQIEQIKTRVGEIQQNLIVKKQQIDQGYKDLEKQELILEATIRDFYIKSYFNSPLLVFLSESSASQVTRILAYQKAAANEDKSIITNIALSIQDLETKRKDLQNEQTRLSALKANLNDQSAKLDKVIEGAKAYQASLNNQIAEISARQSQILAQRLASLNIPLTAYAGLGGGCSSDLTNGKNPGFSPAFGFFTYGVPNRVGLNQYGALGRSQANPGVSYWDILHAYYNFSQGTSGNPNIHVVGTNNYGENIDMTLPLEQYLQHIYEMPASWPAPALEAQAVAARSYVLAYTNNGANPICPSDHCQEFKTELNSQSWINAVNATANQTMTYNGSPISAWFSSTHGGYVHASGGDISGGPWTKNAVDTPSGTAGSFSDLQNNAYDKNSPWFYCDWGSRSQYDGTAWLTSSEVADIANVLLLVQKDPSVKEHLYQTDKPNPAGTDTWSADQVKQELRNRGGTPFNSVSNISVSADFGSGVTTSVNVTGDAPSQSFSGSDFKTYFDLRAPANIQIVGPLYNVEQK